MKNTPLHTALIALVMLTPLSIQAEETKTVAPAATTQTVAATQSDRDQARKEMRANMEKMQEQSFQKYIESLKNHPAADQLPTDVQERRASMIQDMQDKRALMLKVRKQRRQEFEERRSQRMQDLKKI